MKIFLTRLNPVFHTLLNISIAAAWIVLAVLLVKTLFRKMPKKYACALWGIVGLRLIFPLRIESIFSLIPSSGVMLPEEIASFSGNSPNAPVISIINNPIFPEPVSVTISSGTESVRSVWQLFGVIWLIGVLLMFCYAAVSTLRLKHRLSSAFFVEENVKQSEWIDTPFLLGIIHPVIYLPCGLQERETACILAHERAHIQRKDYLWKPLGFLLLSVYWFNPVLWLGYILLCRDIETACDEKVIAGFCEEERQEYSGILLKCSIRRTMIRSCPVAFGEGNVKGRIRSIMNYKKPAFWVVTASVVLCAVLSVCLLTSPKMPETASDYDISRDRTEGDGSAVISDPSLPGVTVEIVWGGGPLDSILVRKNGRELCTVDPKGFVQEAFFYDVTGDGKAELCFSADLGFGIISRSVAVCELSREDQVRTCRLENRGVFDYDWDRQGESPEIVLFPAGNSEIYSSGTPVIKQGKLFVYNGLQYFSGSELADEEQLLAKYASREKFDFSENLPQLNLKNNPADIISDYYYRILCAADSGLSHDHIRPMEILSLAYIPKEEILSYEEVFPMTRVEDAVILQDAKEFAAFYVTYYLGDAYEDPEMNAMEQYPSGDYARIYVLGDLPGSDGWSVICYSAPLGGLKSADRKDNNGRKITRRENSEPVEKTFEGPAMRVF